MANGGVTLAANRVCSPLDFLSAGHSSRATVSPRKVRAVLVGYFVPLQYRPNADLPENPCASSTYQKGPLHMLVTTLALVVVTALCLVFAETRLMGVLGTALLIYLHPLLLLAVAVLVVVAGVAFYFHRRRSYHALPGPDSEID